MMSGTKETELIVAGKKVNLVPTRLQRLALENSTQKSVATRLKKFVEWVKRRKALKKKVKKFGLKGAVITRYLGSRVVSNAAITRQSLQNGSSTVWNTLILKKILKKRHKKEESAALELLKVKLEKRESARAPPISERVWQRIVESEKISVVRTLFLALTTAARPESLNMAKIEDLQKVSGRVFFSPEHSKKGSKVKCSLPCACIRDFRGVPNRVSQEL